MAASVLSPVPSLGGAGGGSSVHDHICVHGGHEAARAASSTAADSARRWPSHIDTALAWSGPDLDGDEYTYVLSAEDKAEVDGALKIFKGTGSPTGVRATHPAGEPPCLLTGKKTFACRSQPIRIRSQCLQLPAAVPVRPIATPCN